MSLNVCHTVSHRHFHSRMVFVPGFLGLVNPVRPQNNTKAEVREVVLLIGCFQPDIRMLASLDSASLKVDDFLLWQTRYLAQIE